MEFLLEVRWDDPIAASVARILSSAPEGMEQMTSYVPQGQDRAFAVYRSASLEVVEGLAQVMSNLGAQVQLTPTR